PAIASGPAGDLDDQVDGRGDLLADGGVDQPAGREEHHGLQPAEGIDRAVGVAGGEGPFVPGVHGLHHVQRFGAPDLAHDDPVGPHAKRFPYEVADADRTGALAAGWAGLETYDVVGAEAELGGVLHRDDPLPTGQ